MFIVFLKPRQESSIAAHMLNCDQHASDEIDCETLGRWQCVTLEWVFAERSAVWIK